MKSQSRRTKALPQWVFFLPAILALGGSRWISRIEVGPIFFLDWFLILSSVVAFLTLSGRGSLDKVDFVLVLPFLILPVFAVLVSDFLSPSELFFRDLYPYLSLGFGGIVALMVRRMNSGEQKAIAVLLLLALTIHWVWVSLLRILTSNSQGQEVGLSWFRPDIDGALIGVILIIGIFYSVQRGPMVMVGVGIASTIIIIQVSSFGSRAAVVATIFGGIWTLGVLLVGNPHMRIARLARFSIGSGILLLGGMISLLAVQDFQERSTAVLVAVADSRIEGNETQPITDSGLPREEDVDKLFQSGAGPALARLRAWEVVLSATASEAGTLFIGSGLGSSFFTDSGAAAELLGVSAAESEGASRHSHNMFVGLAGLLGLPAAIYLLLIIAFAQRIAGRYDHNEAMLLKVSSVAILNVLTVASFFGVIWEGPYGAIPMSFSIGILFGLYARQLKLPPPPSGECPGFIRDSGSNR